MDMLVEGFDTIEEKPGIDDDGRLLIRSTAVHHPPDPDAVMAALEYFLSDGPPA